MDTVLLILIAVLSIGGAFFVLVSALAMLRVGDGLSRINVLSPATGIGLPAIVAAAFIHDLQMHGFDVFDLIKTTVAIVGFIILSSVASNTLGRATYRSGCPLDPDTQPNELAQRPSETPRELP
ncbi:MAG: cation:proton antiporter [Ornithinimicrobium sp.]|jgi:multicomponent Na+:H+ antiporter subunit G|uniref:cation:proton antiporter n=1 Tax=Ornithinimicrobium sp. TaxID=1977084 RepID=UPI003D9BFCA8